ncbi:MAG: DoxX family protein [Allomuricauda sp.]|nr:MAG: DoxX family protein [Allomuricauda sp.]
MKKHLITYYTFLGLFSVMILTSLYNHLFDYAATVAEYASLGYPEHLVKPLAIAQFFGLFAIWYNKKKMLVEWAYGGFFANLTLAVVAHYSSKYGNGAEAVICLILLLTTYSLNRKRIAHSEAHKEESKVLVKV